MRFAMNDIQRIYRDAPTGSPCEAIRVSHRLGTVWYAGLDRVLPPEPSYAHQPWMQVGVFPRSQTDGVEDRLVVADAELARHGLAWRLDAPANRDNLFVRLARQLELVERVEAAFGTGTRVQIAGGVHTPLSAPRLVIRTVAVAGTVLGGPVREGALDALGLG